MPYSKVTEGWHEGQELCFDPSIFLKDNFSIDEFLRSHRNKATLEVLRYDLGSYLKTLRLSMIELINKDYEDFVNLSKHLVGLNAGIDALQAPLDQVKLEILVIKNSLQETIDGIKNCLERDRVVKEKKQQLFHLTQAIDSIKKLKVLLSIDDLFSKNIDLNLIERASREFSMLQFLISRCDSVLSTSQRKDCNAIEKTLMEYLCNVFLESLSDVKTYEIDKCLRIFYNLNKIDVAVNLIRTELVAPFLNNIISEASLSKEENGLRGIFYKLLTFTDGPFVPLFTLPTAIVGQFNFLVDAFWTELVQRFEVHMKSVFAAGDPNVFYQRFTDTMAFLEQLRQRCQSPEVLDSHQSTVHFMQKWNLLVYYKIRFQEIAGVLENVISNSNRLHTEDDFKFAVTKTAVSCLQRCWEDGVFIPQLAHAFWKLSLQIIGRYSTWVEAEAGKGQTNFNNTNDLGNPPHRRLETLVSLYQDCHQFSDRSLQHLHSIKEKIPTQFTESNAFSESISSSETQLQKAQIFLSTQITSLLVVQCVSPLSHVKDIPRLFRKTNRDMPTKPCDYVQSVVQPVSSFIEESSIDISILDKWVLEVLTQVTNQFYLSVNDVLESAQKTEESLRRLKKAKEKSVVSQRGVTDDDKIKQQLVVDVYFYRDRILELSKESGGLDGLKKLVQLVENAKEKSDR